MPSADGRRRRRAVGPAGAAPAHEPRLDLPPDPDRIPEAPDADSYCRERPPHHDREG